MPTDAAAVASTGARELKKGVVLFNPAKRPNCANRLVGGNMITDTRSFIKIATFTVPGLPQAMDPFDAFPEDQFSELDNAQFDCDKFGLKLRWSDEVWSDNQFGEYMRNFGTVMRKRFFDRREIIVTDKHFNDIQTNAAPNGKYYADDDIPLDDEAAEILGSASYSNWLDGTVNAPSETPSEHLVDLLSQLLMYEPDNKGVVNGHMQPFDVFCHPKWFGIWTQIKRTRDGNYGSSDPNGYNYAATLIDQIVPLPYATHEDWTRMQAKGDEIHAFIWDRDEFKSQPLSYDDANDTMKTSATMRIVTDEFHQAGTCFSIVGS